MGMDLRLLPFSHDGENGFCFSHAILPTLRDDGIYAAIRRTQQFDVSDKFNSFLSRGSDGKPCYGATTTTPYGDRLTYTSAQEIIKAVEPFKLVGITKAAIDYLRALPANTKVALFWH